MTPKTTEQKIIASVTKQHHQKQLVLQQFCQFQTYQSTQPKPTSITISLSTANTLDTSINVDTTITSLVKHQANQ